MANTSSMRRMHRRWLPAVPIRLAAALGTVAALAAVSAPAAVAGATSHHRSGTHDRRVPDSREAWYAASPASAGCSLATGCLPAPNPLAPTYPKGTLHVGVNAGRESARSYVVPALAVLPNRAVPTSGSLVLPVDTDNADGTTNLGNAVIEACLVAGRVKDGVAGSSGPPPSVDCKTHVAAGYDTHHKTFTVALGRFLAAWRAGAPERGIALLPDTAGDLPTDSWQVTFDGRGGKHPVHSLVGYRLEAAVTTPAPPGGHPAGPGVTSQPAPNVPVPATAPGGALPGGSTAAAPGAAPQVAPQSQGAPPAPQAAPVAFTGRGFAYPMIFLIPILLLVGAVYFSRVFTANPLPARNRS